MKQENRKPGKLGTEKGTRQRETEKRKRNERQRSMTDV